MRRLFPTFPGGPAAVGLLVLRVVAGSAMALHGWPKIQKATSWMPPEAPIPGVLQAAAAVAEFGGGICWVLGALTPLASFLILCTMAVAAGMVHIALGHPFVATSPDESSWELAAIYFAIAVMLMLVGPGRLSVDALAIGRRRSATTSPGAAPS